MRKSYLPITISEVYSIPLETVNEIIEQKQLTTDRLITEFFATNKDKIIEFTQKNAISSIIDEEFREIASVPLSLLSAITPSLSSIISEQQISAYAAWMKQNFPTDWAKCTENKMKNTDSIPIQSIWPKYAGSLLIEMKISDYQNEQQSLASIKQGTELCVEFGQLSLQQAQNSTTSANNILIPNISSLYIMLHTKRNHFIGNILHRFYFIWVILHQLNYVRIRVFTHSKSKVRMDIYFTEKIFEKHQEFLMIKGERSQKKNQQELSLDQQRAVLLRKYGCEALRLAKDFLQIKETIRAQLTPVENSLNLLAQIQNKLLLADDDDYLKLIPARIVMKPEFLEYYISESEIPASKSQLFSEQKIDESVANLLSTAEKIADSKAKNKLVDSEIESEMEDTKKKRGFDQPENNGIENEGKEDDDEEDEDEVEEGEVNSNQGNGENDDEASIENLEEEDFLSEEKGKHNEEEQSEKPSSEIEQLQSVNAERINESFVLTSPPSSDFKSELFNFQKQALTWMLYKESAISLNQAMNQNQSWPVFERTIGIFWSELVFLDGSLIYFNEYGQLMQKEFPKIDKSLHSGGILADEMGLGKTVMAMSLIASNRPKIDHKIAEIEVAIEPKIVTDANEKLQQLPLTKKFKANGKRGGAAGNNASKAVNVVQQQMEMPASAAAQGLIKAGTLIVLPLSVLSQWVNEIELHFKKESVFYFEYYNEKRRSGPKLHLYDIVLTTYNILGIEYRNVFIKNKRPKTTLFDYAWHRIILDEAHTIKGKGNYCARGAYSLEAQSRWCLTGTPLHNCFDDLYSLINFLKVEVFQDYYWWNKHVNRCQNLTEVFRLLQTILEPILLRRTKKTKYSDGLSIVQLPKKSHKMLVIPFSQEEKKLYNMFEQRAKDILSKILTDRQSFSNNYFHIFSIMTKLRQICDHPLLLLNKLNQENLISKIESLDKEIQKCKEIKSDTTKIERNAYLQFMLDLVNQVMQKNSNKNDNNNNSNEAESNLQFQKNVFKKVATKNIDECFCFEPYGDEVSIIPCGHCFHAHCIQEHYDHAQRNMMANARAICPVCRATFQGDDIKVISYSEVVEQSKASQITMQQQLENRLAATVEEKKQRMMVLNLFSPEDSSKLTIVVQEIEKVHNAGEKVIVYSQFLGFLKMLQETLLKKDIDYTRLNGSMNKKERTISIKRFSEERSVSVILISLKAGAFGLNLIAANHVFICDPWYNPAIEEQAIERCHRIGQKKRVNVIHFIMDQSIEQRILACQKNKRNLILNTLQNKSEKSNVIQDQKIKEISFIMGFNKDEEQGLENLTEDKKQGKEEELEKSGDEIGDEKEGKQQKAPYEVQIS